MKALPPHWTSKMCSLQTLVPHLLHERGVHTRGPAPCQKTLSD